MKYSTIWHFCILFLILFFVCSGEKKSDGSTEKKSDSSSEKKPDGGSLNKLFKVAGKFYPFFEKAMTIWGGYKELKEIFYPKPESNLNEQLGLLAAKVDKISRDMKFYHGDLKTTLDEMEKSQDLKDKTKNFIKAVSKIETVFTVLISTINKIENFTYDDVKESIRDILEKKQMAKNLVDMITCLIEMRDIDVDIFQLIRNPRLEAKQVCSSKKSIQQKLYSLYLTAHNTLVKGMVMQLFAHQMNDTKSDLIKERGIQVSLGNYFEHTKQLTEIFQNNINVASRDLWTCESEQPDEGTNFERFGRAFQRYLFNMKNIEPLGVEGGPPNTCIASCENVPQDLYEYRYVSYPFDQPVYHPHKLTTTKSVTEERTDGYAYYDDDNYYYPELLATHSTGQEKRYTYLHDDVITNRCHGGTLRNCEKIDEADVQVCKAESNRIERYSYMKYGNKVYGDEASCPGMKPVNISRPEVSAVQIWGVTCNYCMCTCDYGDDYATNLRDLQRLDTDRYIDLKAVVADEGYVITGIRLRKNSTTHTFHLDIKQAKLLPEGRVSDSGWKITQSYYPRAVEKRSDGKSRPLYTEHVDYHKIAFNNTVVLLDKTKNPYENQVVTGVSFEEYSAPPYKNDGRRYLRLGVRFADFDFASGNLRKNDGWYPKSWPSLENRNRSIVADYEAPTGSSKRQNSVMTDQGAYVELSTSGLQYDVGQNVLPFVDIQPVETNPPAPLTGLGLYHRNFKESGGYLGLKVVVFDHARYLPSAVDLDAEQQKLLNLANSKSDEK